MRAAKLRNNIQQPAPTTNVLAAASSAAASLSLTCPACAAPAWLIIVNAVSVVVVVVTARLSLVDARATTPDLFSAFAIDFVAFVARSAHRGAAYIVPRCEDARVITAHRAIRSGRASVARGRGVRKTVFRLQAMNDAARRERARTRAKTRWPARPRARGVEGVEGGD